MPQMMPINWIFSFFLFILCFSMFMIMNYYIFNYKKNNKKKLLLKKNTLIWKW
uniref:ATP synthase complex subunit 8 n=1 Tax=Sasakia funebris TaxID=1207000 RepID=S4SCP1_9NEOP|nr:ATP synthase F0 subunit 8 [Sasakia funebris]AFN29188.1 ATP synthase F0 subunit 8 [Sasakia funebris]